MPLILFYPYIILMFQHFVCNGLKMYGKRGNAVETEEKQKPLFSSLTDYCVILYSDHEQATDGCEKISLYMIRSLKGCDLIQGSLLYLLLRVLDVDKLLNSMIIILAVTHLLEILLHDIKYFHNKYIYSYTCVS